MKLLPVLVVAVVVTRTTAVHAQQNDFLGGLDDFFTGILNDLGLGLDSSNNGGANCNYKGVISRAKDCQGAVAMGEGKCPLQCRSLVEDLKRDCPDLLSVLDSQIIKSCSSSAPTSPTSPSFPPTNPGQTVITIDYDYEDTASPAPDTPSPASPSPQPLLIPVSPPPFVLIPLQSPPPPPPIPFAAAAPPPLPLITTLPPPFPALDVSPPSPMTPVPPPTAAPDLSLLPQACYDYVKTHEGGLSTCGSLIAAGVAACPTDCIDFYGSIPIECIAPIYDNSAALAAIYNVPSNISDPTNNNPCAKLLSAAWKKATPVLLVATLTALSGLLLI